MAPKISVILPVKNGEDYIERAVESVLAQTFKDFELLILINGSTDSTSEKIQKYKSDSRVKIVEHKEALGLMGTGNEGLELATGEFIARLDGDDYSEPNRFEKQLRFFDAHPEISILGSAIKNLGLGYPSFAYYPEEEYDVWAELFFACPFAHSSVMFRRQIFRDFGLFYGSPIAEDYELWSRSLLKVKGANLREVLVHYQNHPKQMSVVHLKASDLAVRGAMKKLFAHYDIQASEKQLDAHEWFCKVRRWSVPSPELLDDVVNWVQFLSRAKIGETEVRKQAFLKNLSYRVLQVQNYFYFKDTNVRKALAAVQNLPAMTLDFDDFAKGLVKGLLR